MSGQGSTDPNTIAIDSRKYAHGIRRAQGIPRAHPNAGTAADVASTQPFSQAA